MTFHITVEPSKRAFTAEPSETLLNAAIRQGVNLPYGCKDGACGSCKCRKLSGEVSHLPFQAKAMCEDERASGMVLTCRAVPLSNVVLESRQVAAEGAFPVKKMPVRVSQLQRLSHDVMLMRLQLPAAEPLRYRAGQYVDVLLRDGQRRSYSMANAPHNLGSPARIELHLRLMHGGLFTEQVFGTLKEKDILRIEGPFGSFYLREASSAPMIFLASGTGFAPIKALIEHLQHQGITRPVALYWGGRRPADLYMDSWVREQVAALPQLRYIPVVSDALPEDHWQGRTGLVHQAVMADWPDLSAHEVYACGAPVMVDAARRDFVAHRRLDPDAFFADSFTTAADRAAVPAA